MSLPSFLLPWFAIAGLAAAAGPLLIHLLNRRRYRVVQWAAMDFLREAVVRSRRILQMRDLLLLLLRMACLVAFGAALARPFFARSAATVLNPDQPVHAVVLVDNSMSMGYQKLDGTLMGDAKAKAKEVIEQLPRGSRISVLPTCGSARGIHYEAYVGVEDALEALAAIQPVDRSTRPDAAIDLALEACRRLPSMAAKRVFLVTDQQAASWPAESLAEHLKQLPSPMQVIVVKPEVLDNAWIADFKLRDGIVDLQTPGTLVATIGYQGPAPRRGVQVTLTVDGATVATQTVDLQPGQMREVQFPPYKFDVPTEPGKPTLVTAEVSIPTDRLAADDHRYLVVPVVAALPVVFVDSAGAEEDPRHGRYGETFYLRRLLAPLTRRKAQERQLIQVRHVKPDQLSQETLADARLCIVAGILSPKGLVPLLREYVEQGGNLIIAAGGDFDPAAWTEAAWADGLGILPAPLKAAPVGRLPEETSGQIQPFLLDFDSLVHEYFLPPAATEEDLKAMYGPPTLFFKAVAADVSDDVQKQAAAAVAEHFDQRGRSVAQIDRKLSELSQANSKSSGADALASRERGERESQRIELERQRAELRPNWLLWRQQDGDDGQHSASQRVEQVRARVMGRFTNGLPFMVRRPWGHGQVLLVSTGVSPGWNTLPVVRQAVWVYDRICRSMLLETFPSRTVTSERPLLLPVAPAERSARFALVDSGGQEQPLSVDAMEGDRYGITLGTWTRRGIYHVTAARAQQSQQEGAEARLWDIPVAVNGPAEESELGSLGVEGGPKPGRTSFLEATHTGGATFVELQGTDLWKWLLAGVLAGLLVETALLAWFYRGSERTT